jgi:predicted anti-sigma-YlaC factor YlaD
VRCEEFLEALNDYVDGGTSSVICLALQNHLADCNPCRIVIDNIRQTITLYRVGTKMPVPIGLHHRLRYRIRDHWTQHLQRTGPSQ